MASQPAVMRPLKDGAGYSLCRAPEDKVGKRKCKHVPNTVSFEVQVKKIDDKINEIVIGENFIELNTGDKVALIERILDKMEPVPADKAAKILNKLARQ